MAFKRIKDWLTTITAFRSGDLIPVDGPSGTAKMSKDALISQVAPNNKNQVYITDRGSLFYEESNTSLGSIYIKAVNGSFAVRGSSPNRTYSMPDLATALGVSLVTSPSGVTDCLEIEDSYCLVLDSGNNFALKERTAVAQNDIVIVACIEGNICSYDSRAFGYVIARRLRDNDTAIKGVQAVLGETTNSTNYHPFEAGITSGFWLGPNQKISAGDFVKIHVQSSSGVLKYRVYPKGTGAGKPSYNIDVTDDFEFASDIGFTAESNLIQMYIDGLEKDGQGVVVGGSIKFSIDVASGLVGDVKELFNKTESLDESVDHVKTLLGDTTTSEKSQTIPSGITSGYFLAAGQKIEVGNYVKIHVQSSSGVLQYRALPKSSGTGKPAYAVDVTDDYEFVSDTAFSESSNIIQLFIDGMEKDGQGSVVGGSITFEIDVSTKIVSDVKNLLKNDTSQDSRLSSVESTASALNDKNTRKRIQFYANGQSNIYVEESRANLGKVWIKSTSNMWAGRLGVNWNYTNATLATALGKTLETSPKGVVDCIPIGDGDNIVITSSNALACKNRNSVLDSDVVVFACLDGKFRGFDSVIFGQVISDQLAEISGLIGDASNPFYFADTGWMTKQETFCELFNRVSLCDAFLFFTDPHFMAAQDWSNNTKNYVEIIRKWYDCTPTDFIICGGDWLQNNDTQAIALSKLGFIDGIMSHTFDRYYPILGNHDTNYQGVVSADDSSRGDLPQGTLNSIWFNRVGGKSYYDFKARATKFYIFDSGIDWTAGVVSEYEWEQVDWFANKLLAGSDEHIGLMLHLISNNASEIQPVAFAQTLLDIAYAFNSRTSITRHDITYDFSSATGYVEFMLGGHTHSDLDTTFHDIPIVITTRVLTPGTNPTFDLVMVDYTNNKLKMVRIGSGSDREFDLYSASL